MSTDNTTRVRYSSVVQPVRDPRWDYRVTVTRHPDGATLSESVSGGHVICDRVIARLMRDLDQSH